MVTLKDRQALIDEAAKKKVRMEEESQIRKELLEKYKQDQTMKPGANLTEVGHSLFYNLRPFLTRMGRIRMFKS